MEGGRDGWNYSLLFAYSRSLMRTRTQFFPGARMQFFYARSLHAHATHARRTQALIYIDYTCPPQAGSGSQKQLNQS